MKNTRTALRIFLPAVMLTLALSLIVPVATAQNSAPQDNATTQQPTDRNSASEAKTFTGTIVKNGDNLVLSDAAGKTYQLDDQQKAGAFVNKQVKVTGSLDPVTGMIRVNAIEPA
jgi:hypothetical protein